MLRASRASRDPSKDDFTHSSSCCRPTILDVVGNAWDHVGRKQLNVCGCTSFSNFVRYGRWQKSVWGDLCRWRLELAARDLLATLFFRELGNHKRRGGRAPMWQRSRNLHDLHSTFPTVRGGSRVWNTVRGKAQRKMMFLS